MNRFSKGWCMIVVCTHVCDQFGAGTECLFKGRNSRHLAAWLVITLHQKGYNRNRSRIDCNASCKKRRRTKKTSALPSSPPTRLANSMQQAWVARDKTFPETHR